MFLAGRNGDPAKFRTLEKDLGGAAISEYY